MALVRGVIPAGLSLLVVDATQNQKGFEYAMSKDIFSALQSAHVPLAYPQLLRPASLGDVVRELSREFTALLYIAHGRGSRDNDAALIQAGDSITSWYMLKETGINFNDRFVSLCVCEGYCEDMVEAVVKSHVFANTVVGSQKTLLASEARAFFPAFYKSLLGLTEAVIDPDIIREKVQENNHLAADKMVTFSFGCSSGASSLS